MQTFVRTGARYAYIARFILSGAHGIYSSAAWGLLHARAPYHAAAWIRRSTDHAHARPTLPDVLFDKGDKGNATQVGLWAKNGVRDPRNSASIRLQGSCCSCLMMWTACSDFVIAASSPADHE